MPDKNNEHRLASWSAFRNTLEISSNPLQETIEYFEKVLLTPIAVDPYSPKDWPTPWELIQENNYCRFVKILAICYTLQLTDRFSHTNFEIHITKDFTKSTTNYLLHVDNQVIGFDESTYLHKRSIPNTTLSECIYVMPTIN